MEPMISQCQVGYKSKIDFNQAVPMTLPTEPTTKQSPWPLKWDLRSSKVHDWHNGAFDPSIFRKVIIKSLIFPSRTHNPPKTTYNLASSMTLQTGTMTSKVCDSPSGTYDPSNTKRDPWLTKQRLRLNKVRDSPIRVYDWAKSMTHQIEPTIP